MDKKRIILKDLKNHLAHHLGDELFQLILFGSQAMNNENPESDFDILVILRSNYDWKTKEMIIDLCYDIDLKYNIIIDVHILAREEMDKLRGRQPVYLNAIQKGIRA